jgi:hypothetical protein
VALGVDEADDEGLRSFVQGSCVIGVAPGDGVALGDGETEDRGLQLPIADSALSMAIADDSARA